MLNTLASGQPRGTANTSPNTPRRGWSTTAELAKRASGVRPATRRAHAEAGMTPPFEAIAKALTRLPSRGGEDRQSGDLRRQRRGPTRRSRGGRLRHPDRRAIGHEGDHDDLDRERCHDEMGVSYPKVRDAAEVASAHGHGQHGDDEAGNDDHAAPIARSRGSRRRKSSRSASGIGRPRRNPWAESHPNPSSRCSAASSSTPSAVTWSFRV